MTAGTIMTLSPSEEKTNGSTPEVQGDFSTSITPEEACRVRWKVDLVILPIITIAHMLIAMDKLILANGAIYGLTKDTHLTGSMYSWAGSILYFGFLVFDYPGAILIQRLPIAKLYATVVLVCAVCLCCTAATHNFAGLMVVRFVMGMAESLEAPIMSIMTVMWYTNAEQPIRVAFWFSQLQSIITGLVSYGVGNAHTSLAPWRLLFLVAGIITASWTVVMWVFLPDSPMTCWWMTPRERHVAIERVRQNNTGIQDRTIKLYQIKECLLDPKTWLLAAFACSQSIPTGSISSFSALIVSGLGYSPLITTLLGVPTGVIAFVWQLLISIPSAKLSNRRCLIIFLSNVIPIICMVLMWQLPHSKKHGRLAAYYCFYTWWGSWVISTSLSMANTSGHTKKVTMNAIFFLAYCVGNLVGPQVFRSSDAPNYPRGYTVLLICFIIANASIAMYGGLCRWENGRRDKELEGIGSVLREDEAFSDATDREKISFRYTY